MDNISLDVCNSLVGFVQEDYAFYLQSNFLIGLVFGILIVIIIWYFNRRKWNK